MRKGKREKYTRAKDEEVNGQGGKGERECPGPTLGFRRINNFIILSKQSLVYEYTASGTILAISLH